MAKSPVVALPEETIRDLGLGDIARHLSRDGVSYQDVLNTLIQLPQDEAVIRYRQEILADIYDSEPLRTALVEVVPKVGEIMMFADSRKDSKSTLQEAIWRLGELELYVECMRALFEALDGAGADVRSTGLTRLLEFLRETTASDWFRSLEKELPPLREGLRKKKSVTLGINLDERLRPVEATLLSVNETSYRGKSLLPKLFGRNGEDEFVAVAPIHSTPVPEEHSRYPYMKFPLAPLFQDLEKLLGSIVRPLVRTLNRFMSVNTAVLRYLRPHIALYLGAVDLFRKLESRGLPVCRAEIVRTGERVLRIGDFYNLLLALRDEDARAAAPDRSGTAADAGTTGNGAAKVRAVASSAGASLAGEGGSGGGPGSIVLNDAGFDDSGRIFILTGPNQGGKTTFTQGIGIAQVLAQCGLLTTARTATLSPVDLVVTHFPAEERGQLSTGRLGEEAERFARLFHIVTRHSLVLLNESLTSTSPGESEYLAEDIIRALSVLGVRGVFATHLHGLAERVEEINRELGGRSMVATLVAGVQEVVNNGGAHRTYRIHRGPPAGKSFARDIAERYGISYDQLTRVLKERNVL